MTGAQVLLDDLPRYSPWPARLLGLERCPRRRKSRGEVWREFERDKWGALLARVSQVSGRVDLDDVDSWELAGAGPVVFWEQGRLQRTTPRKARRRYLAWVRSVLQTFGPATGLVELGAGYGGVLLSVARQSPFADVYLGAGEPTDSGRALIARVAAGEGRLVEVGSFDFRDGRLTGLCIPEGAVLFSSFALHYVPILRSAWIDALCRLRPRAVVHFEPCYEHFAGGSLLDMMRRRYAEVNDYNRNLVTVLRAAEGKGRIRLLAEQPSVFGTNALLPASLLAWSPRSPTRRRAGRG